MLQIFLPKLMFYVQLEKFPEVGSDSEVTTQTNSHN